MQIRPDPEAEGISRDAATGNVGTKRGDRFRPSVCKIPQSICVVLLVLFMSGGQAQADEVTTIRAEVRLEMVDEGISWVSGYWGYNAPKLVDDGEFNSTLGSWGSAQATSSGIIYRRSPDGWERGHEWEDLNYQPGMLLLDSDRRLLLVYPRKGATPAILRGRERGNHKDFDSLVVPAWLRAPIKMT